MIWHLFDYDHTPGGSFYGVKRSMCSFAFNCWNTTTVKPQLMFMPASKMVGAINHHGSISTNATIALVAIYNVAGAPLYNATVKIPSIPADSRMDLVNLQQNINDACTTVMNRTLMVRLKLVCEPIPVVQSLVSHIILCHSRTLISMIIGLHANQTYWIGKIPLFLSLIVQNTQI